MEELHYKSNQPYISYRNRTFELLTWVMLSMVLTVFVLIGIIIEPFMLLPALYLGLGNYFIFAKRARFYLDEINLQENMCYVQYYDKDTLKKKQISLENLKMKLKTIYTRGENDYKLCIYDNKKLITSQFCGIGYWSKEICKEIVTAYAQIRNENVKQEKKY